MRSHLFNMTLYALVIAALLSLVMRDRGRDRLRFTVAMSASMVGAAVVAAWLMRLIG